MLDIRLFRDHPDVVRSGLVLRGEDPQEVDAVIAMDLEHRSLLARQETLRQEVKALSREVGTAKKSGDEATAQTLAEQSRAIGDAERELNAEVDQAGEALRNALLLIPNLAADDCPVGTSEQDNVEVRRWWPGLEQGFPFPTFESHQLIPHWEVGETLGILDLERGARMSGSMFPLFRGMGSRLLRALESFALDAHMDAYEELRPPTFVLTETITATGHLPKFADEAYHIGRDDLWAIPTAEVPLTSMHRGEILEERQLPLRFTASSACFRREAGSAGRDTRGVLRVHEFDKVELVAYTTPDLAKASFDDILTRAEALLRALGLTYRVLDLCTGDISNSVKRTLDLEVFSPGCDRWLEVSSVSWFGDYQARRANIRFRPEGGGSPVFVHTLNGSALAWPR
ncbi:MAG: serine--tRNA ligase, partial [Actinomycetota bacterium]